MYDQASAGTHDVETGATGAGDGAGAGAGAGAAGAGAGAGDDPQFGVPLCGVEPQTQPIGGYPFAFS